MPKHAGRRQVKQLGMKMRKRLAIIVLCCVGCFFVSYYKIVLGKYFKKATTNVLKKEAPVILLYTTWNLEEYWSDLYPENLKSHLKDSNCSITDCTITYDKEKIATASAVLFHAQDLTSDDTYLPKSLNSLERLPHQRWVWVNQESPLNLKNVKSYNGMFSWTATYHRNSDIFLPYGNYVKDNCTNFYTHSKFLKRLLKQKRRLVAWAVSDCGGLREKFVLKLQNYLNITVFGKCNKRFKCQDSCIPKTTGCSRKLKQYKFYLSFENSICEDYVTEKYWENALLHSSVPIVFGANYDKEVAIPGSFINIQNFKSVIALANYISFLDRNDDHYFKYFDWKKKFKATQTEDLLCLVCKKLHNQTMPKKVYENLDAFWSRRKHCNHYDVLRKKVQHQLA